MRFVTYKKMKHLRIPAVFSKRRKAILGGGLVLAAIVALWFFVFSPGYQVEILDNCFHITAFKVSHGTKHSIYNGDPLTGKFFAKLRQVGIHIGNPRHGYEISLEDPDIQLGEPGLDTYLTKKKAYVFMMRFTDDFNRKWIQADLIDRAGKVVPLHSSCRYNVFKNEYLNVWIVDNRRTMIDEDADYYLRLTLPERNLEVARIQLGKLRKWKR